MTSDPLFSRPLILIGAGGHAKVLHALAVAAGHNLLGVCDPRLASFGVTHWRGLAVLGGDEALENVDPQTVGLVNGIGQTVGSVTRRDVFERHLAAGFYFPILRHPMAWVAPCVKLAQGVQIMAGVIIQPEVQVGFNSIINTGASVDHDCFVGAHVHIAPGAVLCGGVSVGDDAFIGSGATIIQQLSIGDSGVVAAGATLARSLPASTVHRPYKSQY